MGEGFGLAGGEFAGVAQQAEVLGGEVQDRLGDFDEHARADTGEGMRDERHGRGAKHDGGLTGGHG